MATALDSAFLSGFKTGGDVVNESRQGAMNLLSRLQTQQQLQQEQALLPIRQKLMEQQREHLAAQTSATISQNDIRNQEMAGVADFSQAMANVTDWASPAQVRPIYELGKRYPATFLTMLPKIQANEKAAEAAAYHTNVLQNRLETAQKMLDYRIQELGAKERMATEANQTRLEIANTRKQSAIEVANIRAERDAANLGPHFDLAGLKTVLKQYADSNEGQNATPEAFKERIKQIEDEFKAKAGGTTPATPATPQTPSGSNRLKYSPSTGTFEPVK